MKFDDKNQRNRDFQRETNTIYWFPRCLNTKWTTYVTAIHDRMILARSRKPREPSRKETRQFVDDEEKEMVCFTRDGKRRTKDVTEG